MFFQWNILPKKSVTKEYVCNQTTDNNILKMALGIKKKREESVLNIEPRQSKNM